MQPKLTPGALTAALGRRPRHRAAPPAAAADRTRGTRRWSASLLYGADATDEMVLAGAEIMHASTVRAFTAFCPPSASTTSARS